MKTLGYLLIMLTILKCQEIKSSSKDVSKVEKKNLHGKHSSRVSDKPATCIQFFIHVTFKF